MPTREEIEAKVLVEYDGLVHRTVKVRKLSGYVENDSYEFECPGGETTVKVCSTDRNEICRWMGDGWLDPVYEVEIVDEGRLYAPGVPAGTLPTSCWIYGTSMNLDGREEPGDLVVEGLPE